MTDYHSYSYASSYKPIEIEIIITIQLLICLKCFWDALFIHRMSEIYSAVLNLHGLAVMNYGGDRSRCVVEHLY